MVPTHRYDYSTDNTWPSDWSPHIDMITAKPIPGQQGLPHQEPHKYKITDGGEGERQGGRGREGERERETERERDRKCEREREQERRREKRKRERERVVLCWVQPKVYCIPSSMAMHLF